MTRIKSGVLSKANIKTECLGVDGGRRFYPDGRNGLLLSVDRRSGDIKYAFHFEGKLKGQSFRFKIGNFSLDSNSAYSIEDARRRAVEATHLVDRGIDPRKAKIENLERIENERNIKRSGEILLAEIWFGYLASRAKDIRPLSALTIRDYKKHIQKSFSIWAQKPARQITKLEVLNYYSQLVDQSGPAQAIQAFRYLSAVLNWTMQNERYQNIFQENPVLALKKKTHKIKPRENCLEKSQIKSWWTACDEIDNEVAKAYLKLLLLTGARREELLSLRRIDINFKWSSFILRDTKNGDDRLMPLTPKITEMIKSLPEKNEWVFCSKYGKSGRLREPAKHIKKIQDLTGLHISSHDLRRSFATLSEWAEVPEGAIKQIMGHKPTNVTEAHYKRRPLDLLRSVLQRYENFIAGEVGETF